MNDLKQAMKELEELREMQLHLDRIFITENKTLLDDVDQLKDKVADQIYYLEELSYSIEELFKDVETQMAAKSNIENILNIGGA